MIRSKKQMYIVIGAFALVMLLGTVTYAFFNYTRTGSTLWNDSDGTAGRCTVSSISVFCDGSMRANAVSYGGVGVTSCSSFCNLSINGDLYCSE